MRETEKERSPHNGGGFDTLNTHTHTYEMRMCTLALHQHALSSAFYCYCCCRNLNAIDINEKERKKEKCVKSDEKKLILSMSFFLERSSNNPAKRMG